MTPSRAASLWPALRARTDPGRLAWLRRAVEAVGRDPTAIRALFPAVGRELGRGPLHPDGDAAPPDVRGWTVDDAGRALLLLALGDRVADEAEELYRYGDTAEQRAVLRALDVLPADGWALELVEDAVRTNDPRLIAAALGPYALARLDEASLNQAVLKCVFVGIPLASLDGLQERVTPRLSRMLADYVHERVAAGRDVPADVWPVIERHPPLDLLAAIEAELDQPFDDRRRAAAAALTARAAVARRTTRGATEPVDERTGRGSDH
jgi:hypothetical protein